MQRVVLRPLRPIARMAPEDATSSLLNFLLHHDMDDLNRKYFENQEDLVAWRVKKFFQESSCQYL